MVIALVFVNWLSVRERSQPFMKKLLKEKLITVQYSTRSQNTAQ